MMFPVCFVSMASAAAHILAADNRRLNRDDVTSR